MPVSSNTDRISLSLQVTSLSRYSLSPERFRIRVIVNSLYSDLMSPLSFSKVIDARATGAGFRLFVPLKRTSPICSSRSSEDLCSPKTQRIASTTLDFPDPFGPTTPVIRSLKCMTVSRAKLLNPFISRRRSFIADKDRKSQIIVRQNRNQLKNTLSYFRKTIFEF